MVGVGGKSRWTFTAQLTPPPSLRICGALESPANRPESARWAPLLPPQLSTFVKTHMQVNEEGNKRASENCSGILFIIASQSGRRRQKKKHLNSTASLTLIYETSSWENGADLPLRPSLSHIFPAPIMFSPSGHSTLGLSVVRESRLLDSISFTAAKTPRKKKKQNKTKSKFMKYSSATCQKNVVHFYSQ